MAVSGRGAGRDSDALLSVEYTAWYVAFLVSIRLRKYQLPYRYEVAARAAMLPCCHTIQQDTNYGMIQLLSVVCCDSRRKLRVILHFVHQLQREFTVPAGGWTLLLGHSTKRRLCLELFDTILSESVYSVQQTPVAWRPNMCPLTAHVLAHQSHPTSDI